MEAYFKNIKIVELSTVLAGPLVGTFFAELGADVIKIENPNTFGDPTRQWKLPEESADSSFSAYYASANFGKKIVYLNLKKDRELEKFYRLVADADVLINNSLPKVSKKLKTDYDTCIRYNRDLIYAQLYAYDADSDNPGYDAMMQAECGFISMCGDHNTYAKMPVALIDIMASHQLKEGILLAMLQNAKEGKKARLVTVSLYQSAIASLANQASNYLMYDHLPKRLGTMHPNIAPYGDIFESKDEKFIMLGIGSDQQFKKLGETLKIDTKHIVNFTHNKDRVANRKDLNELLQTKIAALSMEELTEALRRKQLPFSFILPINEVFDHKLAQTMVREEVIEGEKLTGVKSIAFDIEA